MDFGSLNTSVLKTFWASMWCIILGIRCGAGSIISITIKRNNHWWASQPAFGWSRQVTISNCLLAQLGATHVNGDLGEHKRHYFVPHHLIFPPINFLYSHMITDIPVLWLFSFFVRTDRERIYSELVSYEAGSLVCTQTARPCCEIGKII